MRLRPHEHPLFPVTDPAAGSFELKNASAGHSLHFRSH
jgi:hypothetical protein